MEIFKVDELIMARIVRADEDMKVGLNFLSEENENLQVSFWNHPSETVLLPHIHNELQRNTVGTSEVVYIVNGSVHLDLYDLQGLLIHETILNTGDLCVCILGGHGYRILEKGTKVLEIKNGPYFGQEADKTLIRNLCPLGSAKP
jgi:hypothetical protein